MTDIESGDGSVAEGTVLKIGDEEHIVQSVSENQISTEEIGNRQMEECPVEEGESCLRPECGGEIGASQPDDDLDGEHKYCHGCGLHWEKQKVIWVEQFSEWPQMVPVGEPVLVEKPESDGALEPARSDEGGWESVPVDKVELTMRDGKIQMQESWEEEQIRVQPSSIEFGMQRKEKPGSVSLNFGSSMGHGTGFSIDVSRREFERVMAACCNEWGYEVTEVEEESADEMGESDES